MLMLMKAKQKVRATCTSQSKQSETRYLFNQSARSKMETIVTKPQAFSRTLNWLQVSL